MKESTLKITTGAMFIAIFSIILLLNRQTGGFFEEIVFYILPIPMVAYSAKYGWKTSIPVLIAMGLISIFFGTVTTIFYAVTEAFIGMVLGSCIYKKVDMTKALFVVMGLSVIVNVLNTIVLASLFGYNLTEDIAMLKDGMLQSIDMVRRMSGGATPQMEQQFAQIESMLTTEYLMRMMVMAMVILGALQGFLVFQLSLLILNRLKFPIKKPKSIFDYYPPRWLSFVAVGIFVVYTFGYPLVQQEQLRVVMQTIGMCAYLYMVLFGFIGAILWLRVRLHLPGLITSVLGILAFLVLPMLLMIVGVLYTTGDWHANMVLEDVSNRKKREQNLRGNAPVQVDASGRYSYTFKKDENSSEREDSQLIEQPMIERSPAVDTYQSYEAKGRGGNHVRRNASAGNRAAAVNRGPKRTSIAQAAHMRTIKDETESQSEE